MSLPDASTKLRLVLDYLPCEACLAQPVDDQDLLCSICARLDRQVAVRVGARTSVLVERPSPPPEPVVIPPAPAPELEQPPPPAPLPEVVVRFGDEPEVERVGVVEVVVEPLAPPAPVPVPTPLPAEAELPVEPAGDEFGTAAPVAEAAAAEEAEPEFEDLFEFTKARDEFFDYKPAPARAPEPQPAPEPEPERPRAIEPADIPQDDFVFRPPDREEPMAAEAPRAIEEEIIPQEEVPVEAPREEQEQWAPPPDFLAEEAQAEEQPEEEADVLDLEPVVEPEPEPAPQPAPQPEPEEEAIVEMEVLPDEEEVVEMEVLPDEPEPAPAAAPAPEPEPPAATTPAGDLYRLRGMDVTAVGALAQARIAEISHFSGRDPQELQERTGLPLAKLQAWVQVADLVQEVGVPIDAAVALVAAGVEGPQGLRDADPDEVADRVAAFGGASVSARDVKRWKRRA